MRRTIARLQAFCLIVSWTRDWFVALDYSRIQRLFHCDGDLKLTENVPPLLFLLIVVGNRRRNKIAGP